MYSRALAREDADREFESDPLADLMFTMIAIVLLALIILLPLAAAAGLRRPDPQPARKLQQAKFVVGGQSAVTISASADGLRLADPVVRLVGLDAIADNRALRHVLEDARDHGSALVLLIDPQGSEAAFELEPLLAAYGPKEIYQLRLDLRCSYARSVAFTRSCDLPVGRSGPQP